MFNTLIDRHKNPINFLLHSLGFVIGVYGLWQHNRSMILLALLILVSGHLFPYREKQNKKNKK